MAGEPDIGPSETDMWLERLRYKLSETDMWLKSQIYGPQKQICDGRIRHRATETDMWQEIQIYGRRNR